MFQEAFYALITVLLTYALVRGAYALPKALASSANWKWSWALILGFGTILVGGFVGMSWGQDKTSDCEVGFPGAVAAPNDPQMAAILSECHRQNATEVNSHLLAFTLVLSGAAAAGIRAGRARCAEEAPPRMLAHVLERAELGQRAKAALVKSVGTEEVERVMALVQGMWSELDALGVDYSHERGDLTALASLYSRHTGKTAPSLAFRDSSAA